MAETGFTGFDAFISYRRSDGSAVAHWLRREFEAFRPPRALRQRYARRLRVYLDTAYERGTADFYEHNIKPALLSARWLIVLATPDARLRPDGVEDWIQREVADFAAGPNGGNVVAVRAGGAPDDPLPADLIERFPRIEIVDLRGASRFAFFNPVRAARLSAEKLKLIAPLLDLPPSEMPLLRQEEELRLQTRLGGATGGALGVLTAVSALSAYALASRNLATRSLEESMFATGNMVLAAAALKQGATHEEDTTRRLLLIQGCALIDKLQLSAGAEAAIAELVACRLERARAREQQQEIEKARAAYDEAIGLAADRHARTGRRDAGVRLLDARAERAEFLVRHGEPAEAIAELERQQADAERLGAGASAHSGYALSQAGALARAGALKADAGNPSGARDAYVTAAAVYEGLAGSDSEPAQVRKRSLAELASVHREIATLSRDLGDAAGERSAIRKAVAATNRIVAANAAAATLQEAAVTYARSFEIARRQGDTNEAHAMHKLALAMLERVDFDRAAEPDLKAKARALRSWLSEQSAN